MGIEIIRILCFKCFNIDFFVFGCQVDAVGYVCRIFLQLRSFGIEMFTLI